MKMTPGSRRMMLDQKRSSDSAILDSLKSPFAILDGEGRILRTNIAWRALAHANGMPVDFEWVGVRYRSLGDLGCRTTVREVRIAADGIEAVLNGRADEYRQIYTCHTLAGKRRYTMQVTRLTSTFVVVSHMNVTEAASDQDGRLAGGALRLASIADNSFRAVAGGIPAMIAYWDRKLRCRFANKAYPSWLGRPPESSTDAPLRDVPVPTTPALNGAHVSWALAGERQQYEPPLTEVGGNADQTSISDLPDITTDGDVVGFFVLGAEAATMKEADAELRLAAGAFGNTTEGVIVTDDVGTILSVNPAFGEITGYEPEEVVGQSLVILSPNQPAPAGHAAAWRDLETTGRWHGELWTRRKNGELFLGCRTVALIPGFMSEPVRYVVVLNDITGLRRKEARIRYLAFHDPLTQLPNRSLLTERLQHMIALTDREQRGLAVMFLDLDRFKFVNDALGHAAGDEVLKAVAQRLQALVRHTDTVARLGGDEFVILLDNPASECEIAQIATRMIASIGEPIDLHGQPVQVGASIGIAMHPGDGRSPARLLKNADTALYAAKRTGANRFRFHAHPAGRGESSPAESTRL